VSEDALVLTVCGRVGSLAAPALFDAIREAVIHPNRKIVIDFAGVDYMSSAGVAVLAQLMTLATDARTAVAVAGLTEPVRLALELSGQFADLVTEPTREAALARLRGATDT
jgi:stage II sporulation protein AA (anti-sigma F factor antagonist)